jgi:pSer/pThr/pTyr-binding forkhead associated (FHA) protein
MPKLILSMDGLVLKEIALAKERITVGRKAHNDIQIDNLAVSGEHAVITTILDDAFLEDRNSTNGTYVNGQPIKKHVLRNNDVIELGKYRLKYIADPVRINPAEDHFIAGGKGESTTDAFSEIQMSVRGAGETQGLGVATAPEAGSAEPAPLGVIQILSGANAGRQLSLSKSLTTLGKPGVQVAVITRRPHGYFLTHVEGTSFPVVNGRNLDSQAYKMNDHDIIELAGVKMEFFFKSERDTAIGQSSRA